MNIIIIGAGNVGYNLAEKLRNENHDITLIEKDGTNLSKINETLDILTIIGNGASPLVLEQAGIKDADMLLAVTNSDTTNLVACSMSKPYGLKYRVARLSSSDYFKRGITQKDYNIDLVINPHEVCVDEIFNLLQMRGVFETFTFCNNKAQLIGFCVGESSPLCNKKISAFTDEEIFKSIRFVAISRNYTAIMPRGNVEICKGDNVYALGSLEAIATFNKWAHLESAPLKKVVISGGDVRGVMLAKRLTEKGIEVIVIEHDIAIAEEASRTLSKGIVFKGDGTDANTLKQAGIEYAQAFVGMTSDDENNLLSCVLAKRSGVETTFSVIEKIEYLPIVSSMIRVDRVVSPRRSTISEILHTVRRGRILSAFALREVEAEVLEMEVLASSRICNKRLSEVNLPTSAVIGMVMRGDEIIPATGKLNFLAGDRAIVFTVPEGISVVEHFFSKKFLNVL